MTLPATWKDWAEEIHSAATTDKDVALRLARLAVQMAGYAARAGDADYAEALSTASSHALRALEAWIRADAEAMIRNRKALADVAIKMVDQL